jgi:hypothetical protein
MLPRILGGAVLVFMGAVLLFDGFHVRAQRTGLQESAWGQLIWGAVVGTAGAYMLISTI